MDNESELPIQYFNFKHSEKNSDILSLHLDPDYYQQDKKSYPDLDFNPQLQLLNPPLFHYSPKPQKPNRQPSSSLPSDLNPLLHPPNPPRPLPQPQKQICLTHEQIQKYFDILFSPKIVTQSLVRRNQYLEIKGLENSQSQEQQIYVKRKNRVHSLQKKEKKYWDQIGQMRKGDMEKYEVFGRLMAVLGEVKMKLNGIRHDYYSQKTFETLKKCSPQQLKKTTKILSNILSTCLSYLPSPSSTSSPSSPSSPSQSHISLYLQFLILPRFIISKQKLQKLLSDETLQQNFIFLIKNKCLGHYNNEANKKLPQQGYMKYVRNLIQKYQDGRQRYKRLCGVNHGGRFLKKYGWEMYVEMFEVGVGGLKRVEGLAKKGVGRKEIQEIIELEKRQKRQKNVEKDQQIIKRNSQKNIHNFLYDIQCNNEQYIPPYKPYDKYQIRSISSMLNMFKQPTQNKQFKQKQPEKGQQEQFDLHKHLQTLTTPTPNQYTPKLTIYYPPTPTPTPSLLPTAQPQTSQNQQSKTRLRRIQSLQQNNLQNNNNNHHHHHNIFNNIFLQNTEYMKNKSTFRMKRCLTVEADRQSNIIIVQPPARGPIHPHDHQDSQ